MKRQVIVTVLIVCLMNLMFPGCGELHKSTDNKIVEPSTELTTESSELTPCESAMDIDVMNPEMRTYYEGGEADILEALASRQVRYIIGHMATEGYEYTPENSFVITGSAVPEGYTDTVDTKIANIILRYAPDESQGYVEISYVTSTNRPDLPALISASYTSFVQPTENIDDYEYIYIGVDDEGVERAVWIRSFISPLTPNSNVTGTTVFDMDRWKKCTAKKAAQICVTAMVGCAFSTVAYPFCVAAACVAGLAGAQVWCALDQWF